MLRHGRVAAPRTDSHIQRTDRIPPGGDRPPVRPDHLFGSVALAALQAEVRFAWHATVRGRAYRMVVLLASLALLTAMANGGISGTHVVLAAGLLGAVGGAILLAPGPALEAVRSTAPPWWVPPVGRLLGAAAAALPVLLPAVAATAVQGGAWSQVVLVAAAALSFLLASAACGMVLGPFVGESAAGALGFVAVWLGGLPPSVVHDLLAGVPYLQRPAVLGWNTLPLAWRARGVLAGTGRDLLVLCCWTGACVVLAAWAVGRVGSGEGAP